MGCLMSTRHFRFQRFKDLVEFASELKSQTLTGAKVNYVRHIDWREMEFKKPSVANAYTLEAEMFFSFHNLPYAVEFDGHAWCENGNNVWQGKITYRIHDFYSFANVLKTPFPGLPAGFEAYDSDFYLMEQYGYARSF